VTSLSGANHYALHEAGCLHPSLLSVAEPSLFPRLAAATPCRQALESFTPRQLRLMFLLQPWEKKMSYGEQVGRPAVQRPLVLPLLLPC
jgi:hypothetical protein